MEPHMSCSYSDIAMYRFHLKGNSASPPVFSVPPSFKVFLAVYMCVCVCVCVCVCLSVFYTSILWQYTIYQYLNVHIYEMNTYRRNNLQVLLIIILPVSFVIFSHLQFLMITLAKIPFLLLLKLRMQIFTKNFLFPTM